MEVDKYKMASERMVRDNDDVYKTNKKNINY